ncbi:MAG: ATP-binding protein [Gammaproteobacteria bacterium]|nr:ATP-binding protein [Gammaproteobacteria bacterium]
MSNDQNKQKFEILGELTAVVAHELKNPLGTIRNSLFLMQNRLNEEYVVDEKIDEILSRIFRNIDRCNNIVNDLLDFTRHTKLIKRRINISQLIDKVLEDLVKPSSIQINNDVSPNLHLNIDPDRMHRVFLNILKNSIEAIMDPEVGKGAGYVNITSSITDQHTIISIYDNGPGIDTSSSEQLFEPLISTKSFGIGLGLSIVQDIMKKHNGCATLSGELDKYAQVDLKFNKKM